MIEIYAAPDLQWQATAIAADLQSAYPGLEVSTLPPDAVPFGRHGGQPAWEDRLILLFGGDPLPPHLQGPIQREIEVATKDGRTCRVLPISTLADRPIPPAPLNQVKALPCVGLADQEQRARIVRRVGALLGLWLRGEHRQVFVSHRQSDGKALAAQVTQYLKDNGYDAWLDVEQLQGAQMVQKEIESHVAKAHLLLLLDTPQAKDSEWIWKEIDAAIAGFVPIFDLILRPADTASARSDFLALNELHHQSFQVSLGTDSRCEPLSEGALASLLAAAEDYMVRILRLQMSLAAKAEETFTETGFDWKVLDDRCKLYQSTKADDDFAAQTRIVSHCSAVSPTFHQAVTAFQSAPIPDPPCNFRLFIHEEPLARPLLERLNVQRGFRNDTSLRILDIAGLTKFLRRFRVEEEV
jgi:hypothetical protein